MSPLPSYSYPFLKWFFFIVYMYIYTLYVCIQFFVYVQMYLGGGKIIRCLSFLSDILRQISSLNPLFADSVNACSPFQALGLWGAGWGQGVDPIHLTFTCPIRCEEQNKPLCESKAVLKLCKVRCQCQLRVRLLYP